MADQPVALQERGVYRAPFLGPQGETVLYAVDSKHRRLPASIGGELYIPPGENPFPANDRLWDLLAERDPVTQSAEERQAS